ncbi:hypothetical protein BDW74DRAFT_171162 [Aspergillus multicolor]|uniref:uncharacterized protein n=1 Tax=Aspergillus multicolor TaxID=41759 RepID=UPI003CCD14BE
MLGPERQDHCSYRSHVKLFYEAGDRGVWSLGSNLIRKDRGLSHPTLEVPNIQFENQHTMILMKRIPGEPLSKVWPSLSTDEKESIAKQTAEHPLELRKLQSDQIQALGGRPVYANFLFKEKQDNAEMQRGFGESIQRLCESNSESACHPPSPIVTFTHGDLTNVNIMVDNEFVTGIIDWETAGYFPVWWKYVCTSVGDSEEDRDWKTLLRKYMPDHSAAREFWLDYYYVSRNPGSERAMKFISLVTEGSTC